MRIVLTIGWQQVLLPSDVGLPAILKALGRGIQCDYRSYKTPPVIETDGMAVRISAEVVPDCMPVVAKKGERTQVAGTVATLSFPGERPKLEHSKRHGVSRS